MNSTLRHFKFNFKKRLFPNTSDLPLGPAKYPDMFNAAVIDRLVRPYHQLNTLGTTGARVAKMIYHRDSCARNHLG